MMHHRKLNMLSIQSTIQNITAMQFGWSKWFNSNKNKKNSMPLTSWKMPNRLIQNKNCQQLKKNQKLKN